MHPEGRLRTHEALPPPALREQPSLTRRTGSGQLPGHPPLQGLGSSRIANCCCPRMGVGKRDTGPASALEPLPVWGSPLTAQVLKVAPCPMGVGAAGNGGSVTVRQGTGPVPSLQPANDRAEHCKPARPGPRMRQPPPPAVAGRFCQAGGPRGQWKWHLLDPCSQGTPGMLQACQGDVHPENLVGSLWAAFPESKAAPSRAALAVHVCERLGQVLPANSLRAARSRGQGRHASYCLHRMGWRG